MIVKFIAQGAPHGLGYSVGELAEFDDAKAKHLIEVVKICAQAFPEDVESYNAQVKSEKSNSTPSKSETVDIEGIKAQAKAEALAELKAEQEAQAKADPTKTK